MKFAEGIEAFDRGAGVGEDRDRLVMFLKCAVEEFDPKPEEQGGFDESGEATADLDNHKSCQLGCSIINWSP